MARIGKGITNPQASYLAALQRELGLPYTGSGMTAREASITIDELAARIGERDKATRAALKHRAGRRRSRAADGSDG